MVTQRLSLSSKTNLFLILVGVLIGVALLLNEQAFSKASTKDPVLKKRQEMVDLSRQLGVTCTYCHDTGNFRSGKMKTYKVALEHIKLTSWLNQKGFKGKPKVDCFLCHRGKAKPDFKEKMDELK